MGPKHRPTNNIVKSHPQWNSLPFDSEQGFILVHKAGPSPGTASPMEEVVPHQVGTFTKDLVLQQIFIWGVAEKQ